MKENRYQVEAIYADGNLSYNLYGIGIAAGNAELKLPLTETGRVFFGEAMRQVGWKFFVGHTGLDWNLTRDPQGD